jgi:hypothetical protein
MSIARNKTGRWRVSAQSPRAGVVVLAIWFGSIAATFATPANRVALERYFDKFLVSDLNRCTTCHLPSNVKDPASLEEFPHNAFGDRLRKLGEELEGAGKKNDLPTRLAMVAAGDEDRDGIDNETELLLGSNPGDVKQTPAADRMAGLAARRGDFQKFLASYRWQPFDRVQRPAIPIVQRTDWVRTPIDTFVAAEHEVRGLKSRPAASKGILLRRVYLDLIGLSPSPEEQRAFEEDHSSDAYEKVVDRLLADPRYGERWGRHWMDVWRYSDWAGWTDGKQVRDSQRHIWRWRDWIVDSLNADKAYDRMVTEMLAGDEVAPDDPDTVRATGFLVRNYKMLSREQWMEDTVKHTAQAFLGVTLGCAKCHDHRADPISQAEYYKVRAIFEPHQVRTDRTPGELDIEKNGLPRTYDKDLEAKTFFFIRGDERKPDKDRVLQPGVPKALCGSKLATTLSVAPVALSREAASPDKRDFVIKDTVAASERAITQAEEKLAKVKADAASKPEAIEEWEMVVAAAQAKHQALLAVLRVEQLEDSGKKSSPEWEAAAKQTTQKQREAAVADALLADHQLKGAQAAAQKKLDEAKDAAATKAQKDLEAATKKAADAAQALAKAREQLKAEPATAYTPRKKEEYPASSTGRRLAFAKWITHPDNPLTARVAVNHLWLRHFGRGIVSTPENFGSDGARPSHPALLDWLAAELMKGGWKMKPIHRMIVTSNTYRMSSTPDPANAQIDPDAVYLWRMPARRMEAELVRDNLLYVSGSLDLTKGGPDIDHLQGLISKRRSLYFRCAAEKEMEFLKIFDGPSVDDCYQRRPTVMPQQSLALVNSELTLAQSKVLAANLGKTAGEDDGAFVRDAFQRILARAPTKDESAACLAFLRPSSHSIAESTAGQTGQPPVPPPEPAGRMRENLILVLFNHHDFVTIR